ncbi:multidrug efflux SMR transporter [Methanosphaera sp. WGK6]|uniref:DMT family transporter n=1 Tax=Methanosphaera sp. WGK6 TaxID=1561964 RepID=UPI00084BD25C|nr:multidrug efflux SMR transporter [Methanosphaera sp. WGK6]OED30790.1 hypothetical protein NL43_00255 [Methanosphaera sp. WGK6]
MNSWLYLVMAGICEVLWAVPLKFSEGFTKIIPSVLTILFLILSMLLLEHSLKGIPLGTAYACWTAIGAVGTVVVGMIFLNESTSLIRIFFIFLVIAGILGLKLTTA